jgi:hypothetical protein
MHGTISAAVWAQVQPLSVACVAEMACTRHSWDAVRCILHQPLAAGLTAGEPPVVLEGQVCADNLDEVQKSFRTRPPPLFRVERYQRQRASSNESRW